MNFDSVSDFLVWLIGPGLPVVVGICVSLLASRIPQWNALPKEVKAIVPPILAISFAYIGKFLLTVPVIASNADADFIFTMALFYLSTQWQHDQNKARLARLAYE
jgi:hypothetical protein